jgi:adenosylhomocysteine nucleosidase
MTYLIITPIQEELDFLSAYLTRENYTVQKRIIGRLPTLEFPELDLILAQGGLGKTQFGLQTQHLLDFCSSVQAVVCAGASGALAEHLRVGDVVVASETVEHDCIYRFVKRPPPRFAGDKNLIDQFEELRNASPDFRIYVGVMASGDEDIVDRSRAEEIHRQTGAVAIAWEGAGGARASRFSGVPYVEVRVISDAADHKAPKDFDANLENVMMHIGWMIVRWLKNQKTK